MIPKKIHYCWFGAGSKPELIQKCIASWHKFCPDWEIIEWNESNYDVSANRYAREAYELKKWAFVSDVARLDIVNRYGGVYLDTDVELLAPIEGLLRHNAFYFFETERNIATGLGFGAVKEHSSIKAMLSYYDDKSFVCNGKIDMTPCPKNNTDKIMSVCPSLIRNGCRQEIDNMCFLSLGEYGDYMKHYGTASWTDHPNFDESKISHKYKNTKIKRFLKQPQRFNYIEKHFGDKAVKIYTFIVYDLLEFGVWFYIKKLVNRIIC